MQRLFLFLLKYRAFIFFTILEVFCSWLIVQNNQYQSASFFNSANQFAATTMTVSNNIKTYFFLREVNEQLTEENARLREQLSSTGSGAYPAPLIDLPSVIGYQFEPAQIINKTTNRFHNYLTINKGSDSGIQPGMGVIGPKGLVGKVKSSSGRFSTVISVLNTEVLVSSLVTSSNTFCTTKWNGKDPQFSSLLYVPRHVNLALGDTVITSGYNAIFPEGIPVGTIDEVQISDEATFYEVRVTLATDFSSLASVYIVKSPVRQEIDSLQAASTTED